MKTKRSSPTVQGEGLETAKSVGDVSSIIIAVGAISNLLPPIAALMTIIWTGIRIYESETVQRLIGKRKGGEQ